jgi:hypothetical protein
MLTSDFISVWPFLWPLRQTLRKFGQIIPEFDAASCKALRSNLT